MNVSSNQSALAGIRIVDLSRVLAGPYCSMVLGDLGAEVIKIERPLSGDDTRQWGPPYAGGESAYYLSVNRNKKSLTLNLKTEPARKILRELIETADVVIENFRPGTMERWGLGYEDLRVQHPGLVYCAISAYGQEGPYRDRPGYDFIMQAEGGLMSITGAADQTPTKVGVAVVDIATALFASISILAALKERDQSGAGQRVDVSLLGCEVAWLANVASNYLVSGEIPARYGNAHPNIVPYEVFQTADGYMALGVGNDRQFQAFCRVAECEPLAEDARFATNDDRVRNRAILIPLLMQVMAQKTSQAWQQLFIDADVPGGPINTIDQVFEHPQLKHEGIIEEVAHPTAGTVRMVRSPIKMSRTMPETRHHPPLLGEHTREILTEILGYQPDEVRKLRDAGII